MDDGDSEFKSGINRTDINAQTWLSEDFKACLFLF